MNAETTSAHEHTSHDTERAASLVVPALAAAVGAMLVNGLIFAGVVSMGVFDSLLMRNAAPGQIGLESVLLVSGVTALAGVGVFALMQRYVENALGWFLLVAVAVLAFSFAAPVLIAGTTPMQSAVMSFQHMVVAAFVVGVALRASR